MKRYLCAWFPDWPLDRLNRSARAGKTGSPSSCAGPDESAPAPPFALTETGVHGVRVVAADAPAERAGVLPGLTLAEARARAPTLASAEIDRAADARALAGLALWMTRFTPVAAVDGADGLLLDITGCAHLFGGEAALLGEVSTRLDRAGISHRLAIAATPGAAAALAHAAAGQLTRLEGPLAPGLADLPVRALRLSEATLALLRRFGLTRIGQLYGLDRRALARRFQSAEAADRVVLRLDQALGMRGEPLAPITAPAEHVARLPCPEPLGDLDGLRAGLARLMRDLARQLETAGLGARRFRFRLYRADGTASMAEAATARPERDPAHILYLFRDRLEALDPGFGVDLLTLEAQETDPMATAPQPLARTLAGTPVDMAALSALADRLTARLGEGAVTVAMPQASHLPERAENVRPFAGALPDWLGQLSPPSAPRPVRMLDPAEPVEVLAEIPDGPPVSFVWRRIAYRVAKAEGPERIGPEWWRETVRPPRTRDYYRVEDTHGQRYWLYREGLYGDGRGALPAWFLQGLFA